MIRRVLCIVFLPCFLASSTACSKASGIGEVVKPDAKGKPELNIIINSGEKGWAKRNGFESYITDFEKKYGVIVNYDVIEGEDVNKKLMTKLAVQNGPELILYPSFPVYSLIKSGAAIDLKGKVANIDKIYSSLRENEVYYVPLGISAQPMILRKEMLDELQIPVPDFSWTEEDYYNIYDKWAARSTRFFTNRELCIINYRYLHKLEVFDYQNKKANINSEEMKRTLTNIRGEIFSGKYKLNENYTYKNYYNSLFEPTSQEFKEEFSLYRSEDYAKQSFRDSRQEYSCNVFRAEDIDVKSTSRFIVRSNSFESDFILDSLGLVVNRNGANLELAYEFVNGLLSDEVQLQVFESENSRFYPVSSAIEGKINDLEKQEGNSEEALQHKQYLLQKIKNGECELIALRDNKEADMYWMLIKDLLPFIFPDKEYSEEELSRELQKIEDKYNIWLSE